MKKILLLSIVLFVAIGLFAQEKTTNKIESESIFEENVTINDTLLLTDATHADTVLFFDDGDTTRIESDNPIKIGENSLIIQTNGTVIVSDIIITNSIQATGAEALKFYTYTHTVTATDITNTYANVTITAVTLADVRNLDAIILDGGSSVKKAYNGSFIDYVDITTTTNVLIEWDSDVIEGDVISISIIEKD